VDDNLFNILTGSGGFLLGYQSIHIHAYNPPQYRCYNCNQVGTHKAGQCRQPHRPQMNWADQMDTETAADSRKRPNE